MIYYIILSYIIILILQILYIKYYLNDWTKYIPKIGKQDLNFNKSHVKDLDVDFTNILNERNKILDKMSYIDWIDYNNKNVIVEYNGRKYETFVYEQTPNYKDNYLSNTDFILRASTDVHSLGLTYSDIIKEKNYSFLFSMFNPNPNMLNNMYHLNKSKGGVNNGMYYWLDPETNRAVKQNFISTNFIKKTGKDHFVNGLIGISYDLQDIELQYSNTYYALVNNSFLIVISLFIFICTALLHFLSNGTNIYKPLTLLIGSNLYLTYFMSIKEGITNLETEQNKVKDINDGILSISFLAAVNIFIIQTLAPTKNKSTLHNESAFLFCVALILISMALYKKSDYNKIDDIRCQRIEKQFMFNLAIIVNLFIFINYLIYVGNKSPIRKLLLSFV